MKVKIIGKADRKGVSAKTNKDYHFTVIHFLGRDKFVEGFVGKEKTIDPDVAPAKMIQLDKVYDFGFDENGNVVSVRDQSGKLIGRDFSDSEMF